MSSGFVSGGTIDNPIDRDDEWRQAAEEIEATHKQRAEAEAQQQNGKSLYEILEANKAAKQEAFEESIKLRNQFRNLDDDEVDFLDSVLESTRAKEAAVRKENAKQLQSFKKQQEEADRALRTAAAGASEGAGDDKDGKGSDEHGGRTDLVGDVNWGVATNKKRKRGGKDEQRGALGGIKLRKSSSSAIDKATEKEESDSAMAALRDEASSRGKGKTDESGKAAHGLANQASKAPTQAVKPSEAAAAAAKSEIGQGRPSLGLAGYSSDEDD